jgi:CRISPR-associated protein Cas1
MEKQIIEINKDGFYLSLFRGFLVVENENAKIKQNIPLENILSLVISANDLTLTKNIVNAICEQGGTIIFCDKFYRPFSITLPYTGHWLISSRIKQQLDASMPLQKNLWKDIVQHKILNQAKVLKKFFPEHKNIVRLNRLAKETLSADSRNNEGLAAGIYFKSLFGKQFVRDRFNDDVNILLNYAYTVLRAMVARAVAGNGLLPYIGIKHCNKMNPLPLVDDLIEPFRAMADKIVYEELNQLVNVENIELTPEIKRHLTAIISYPVQTEKGLVSLNDAIYDFVSSLVNSYELKRVSLKYPDLRL